MTTIEAKDFSLRSDLENKVRNLIGLTPEPKEDYVISGTRDELARLGLSARTTFWGISCQATDPEESPPPQEKPQRGEIHDFGLDGQLKKPPK